MTQLIGLRASAGEGTGGGDTAGGGGRRRSRAETASQGWAPGGGGWGAGNTLPRAPHRPAAAPLAGARRGSELGCPLVTPSHHQTHLGERICRPNSGWARARTPRRVCAWVVPGCPARALFTSITLVTGERWIDSSWVPFSWKEGRGAGAAPPSPDHARLGRLPGSHRVGGALPPHPGRGLFRGVISAIHLSGSREVEIFCLGCNKRKRRRTSRRRKMQFP